METFKSLLAQHHFDEILPAFKALYSYNEPKQAENLRKIFIAMAKDIRVILIKFADRLHNMRTLTYMKKEKQERIANETLTIFAAIASRLGIWKMKWELEDLSFSYMNPEEYNNLKKLIDLPRALKERLIIHASLHYLELKRLNLLDEYFTNLQRCKKTGISFHMDLTVYEKYMEKCRADGMRTFFGSMF